MNKKIYLSSPHMSEEGFEKEYIQEAFDSNWISSLGENVDKFEQELAEIVGANHAVALSSGTAAIHLALKLAGIQRGDTVFCQSLTFSASVNPVIYENANPVFIDSDYATWNLCPESLEKAINRHPEVKALIVVHLYGLSADMDNISAICKRHNIKIIEDAAESLGTIYKGIHTGTLGDYGIFSFNGNKIITTSGGGMLITKTKEEADKARFWATQARDPVPYYQHSELGYNYRMSNILAGIGRGQLKVLAKRVAKKKYIFEYYKKTLSKISDIEFIPENDWNQPNFWLTAITLKQGSTVTPAEIITALEKENIESRHLWKPMHLQPFFRGVPFFSIEDQISSVSEDLFNRGLCLPSDTKMTDHDLDRVCTIIKKLWD